MLQNIKVDIIYYLTPTDFEMEFNLCGCCRMRLLTDKADSRKELIRALSRAVSRSRVIICCGPLFAENGLISNVAAAIDKKLVKADNKGFGIATDKEIDIIDGSLPLVTTDGIFGGCVIESGPQSIIMLSDNKSVRKALLSTLIHPYIEELSRLPETASIGGETAERSAENKSVYEDTDDDTEALVLEEIVPTDINEIEEEKEIEIDAASEEIDVPFTEQIVTLEEDDDENENEVESSYVPLTDDSIDLFNIETQEEDEDDDESYVVADSNKNNGYLFESEEKFAPTFRAPLLILSIIVLLCIVALAFFLIITPLSQGVSVSENFQNLFKASIPFI